MEIKRLTTKQQLQRLTELGIKTDPNNSDRDIATIETIGYYKLKEFAMPFNINKDIQDGSKLKFSDISFKQLVSRYFQDKNLRVNVLHAIEAIEVKLQNEVSYLLGAKYGAFGYLSFSSWCNREEFSRFDIEQEQVFFKKKLLKKVKKSQLPDLKYKHNLNEDKFPSVWLMIDTLTFGDTVHLLKYMSPSNLRSISNKFDCKPSELLSWLECLNLVRNVCCHNSDLLDIQFKTKPSIPNKYRDQLFQLGNGHYTNKIAIAIFIIQQLMLSVNSLYDFGEIEQSLYKIIDNKESLANSLGFSSCKAILALHVSKNRRKHQRHSKKLSH